MRRQHDPNPTDALPGTEAKVRILIRRARQGYNLFHPDDAQIPDDEPMTITFPESPRQRAEAV